jgi:hypothetical protein
MATFRKKITTIEAWKCFRDCCNRAAYDNCTHSTLYPEWIVDALDSGVLFADGEQIKLKIFEGTMLVNNDDWIVKNAKGNLYPCKSDTFALIYEPIGGDMSC